MNEKITFTYKNEKGLSIVYEFQAGGTLSEVVEEFRAFCAAIGYQPETINEILGER